MGDKWWNGSFWAMLDLRCLLDTKERLNWVIGNLSLKFRTEVRAGELHFQVLVMLMGLKATVLDAEFERLNRGEKRVKDCILGW